MAGENEMLDAVKNMCDGVMARMDSMEEERKKEKADAADMKAKWDAAEEEKKKSDKAKADADEKERADAKLKADAEEEEKKAKADAEEKEKEKQKTDAAAKGVSEEVLKRLAELERTRTATHTEEDKARFAEVQMRCDAGFQAWGEQARPALAGESLADYRVALLSKIKKHSKVYKDSNLGLLVADPNAFGIIEASIIADAVSASNSSVSFGAPLQKRVRKTESGHIETRWVGDPAVGWGTFMGGATRFGTINKDMANKSR
jgi:colicin import membrane protein